MSVFSVYGYNLYKNLLEQIYFKLVISEWLFTVTTPYLSVNREPH